MTTPAKTDGLPTVADKNAVPAYLQGVAVTDTMSNLDASDMILPRIKLLQAISAEITSNENAKVGMFWHNVLGEPIGVGGELSFVVISHKKKFLLMAPLGDQRGVLARAEDGVNWSPPEGTFEVKLKNIKETQKWVLKPTVRESGLAEFGSSVAADPDSKPAAVLIYEYLVYLPDYPHLSPIVMSLSRSSAKKGKDLNSKMQFRGAPLNAMRFKAIATDDVGDEGPFKNWMFQNDGWATEDEYKRCEVLAEKFASGYKTADEEGVVGEGDAPKNTEY
jgi:hypothetical protein